MKRVGNLYEQAFSRSSLYQGYEDAKRHKAATHSCYRFGCNVAANIEALHREFMDGSYQPRPYIHFEVHEPKWRSISAPAFRDRVVQHAIYNTINPILDRTFIDQSFACRRGLGTHAASDYVQHALQQVPRDSYLLQLDIRRYYYSLDRQVLRSLIERRIKDRRLVDVIMLYAVTDDAVGVPIGNLLSQLFGLIYLNPLDHFIKRELRAKWYARYVDDFVLIGLTYDQARAHRQAIIEYLATRLHLELSCGTIQRVTRGINFVGFRTWASKRFVRKRALYVFRRAAKRGRMESIVSCLGHASQTASHRTMLNYLQEHHRALYHQLPQSLR